MRSYLITKLLLESHQNLRVLDGNHTTVEHVQQHGILLNHPVRVLRVLIRVKVDEGVGVVMNSNVTLIILFENRAHVRGRGLLVISLEEQTVLRDLTAILDPAHHVEMIRLVEIILDVVHNRSLERIVGHIHIDDPLQIILLPVQVPARGDIGKRLLQVLLAPIFDGPRHQVDMRVSAVLDEERRLVESHAECVLKVVNDVSRMILRIYRPFGAEF